VLERLPEERLLDARTRRVEMLDPDLRLIDAQLGATDVLPGVLRDDAALL
jgi:hypothetical protein